MRNRRGHRGGRRRPIFFFSLLFLSWFIVKACNDSGGNSNGGSGSAVPTKPVEQLEQTVETPFDNVERVEIEFAGDGGQEASLERNAYFIFDGSGSMAGATSDGCRGDQRFSTKLEGAQWAVEEFLGRVPEDLRLGLYVFGKGQRDEVVALGADNHDQFLQAIQQVRAGGGTPLAEAIRFGTDQLVEQYKTQLGYGEFRLVVVTDGLARRLLPAARYAASYGIPIYAIGLCLEEEHPLRSYAVSYQAADNFADLARGLEETLAELPNFDATEFDASDLDASDFDASPADDTDDSPTTGDSP